MARDYIPTTLAARVAWAANFAALITATPAAYGLVPADAVSIAAAVTALEDAYGVAVNPGTRTSAAVAAQNGADLQMQAVCRPFAMRIKSNTAVSEAQLLGLGLNVPSGGSTPVPPPTTEPSLALVAIAPGTLRVAYAQAPGASGRAKPENVVGAQIFVTYGQTPAVDPTVAAYAATVTKSPFVLDVPQARRGQTATIWARWQTRSGDNGVAATGPWSAALSTLTA